MLAAPGASRTGGRNARRAGSTSRLMPQHAQGHLLSFIPSPSINGFHIGPLFIHFYGLMYVVGITLAIIITRRRWRAAGGNPDLVGDVAIWAVPAGIIGGRIYFDITTPADIPHQWWGIFAVWSGGLGIWGGIAGGAIAGIWRVRRSGASAGDFANAIAPGAASRPGRRPDRQLLQPGAVRQAQHAAVGAGDLAAAPARWLPRLQHVPAVVPLRDDL